MNYFIMRKNEPITIAEFSEDGNMLRYLQKHMQKKWNYSGHSRTEKT